jgi:hypothetical protein
VVQGLARHPAAWVDHTVRVRGIALPEAIITTAYRDCSTRDVPCEVSLYPVVDRVSAIGSPALSFASSARSTAGDFVDSHAAVLLVRPDYKSDMLGTLRHVPLLGQYMPQPQRLSFAARAPSVYRVRLERGLLSAVWCFEAPCYDGRLLDASPAMRVGSSNG